jgi:hypothetical protein
MGKIIFLFQSLKITNSSLEDLELTEDFLNNKQVVDELGYDPELLAQAYEEASKIYGFY